MCVVGEFNEVFWGIHRIKGDILIFGKRLLNLIRSNNLSCIIFVIYYMMFNISRVNIELRFSYSSPSYVLA